jgi:hypothetical protein
MSLYHVGVSHSNRGGELLQAAKVSRILGMMAGAEQVRNVRECQKGGKR